MCIAFCGSSYFQSNSLFFLYQTLIVEFDQNNLNLSFINSYDKPVRKSKSKKAPTQQQLVVQSHYQNLTFDDGRQREMDEEDEEDHTYLNIRTYDIPRSATNIYDQPRINGVGGNNLNHVNNNNNVPLLQSESSSDYDYPKGLIPLSARLLLNASRKHLHHYDADSLDGDQSPGKRSSDSFSRILNLNRCRQIILKNQNQNKKVNLKKKQKKTKETGRRKFLPG